MGCKLPMTHLPGLIGGILQVNRITQWEKEKKRKGGE
jgi:hypothetical protein